MYSSNITNIAILKINSEVVITPENAEYMQELTRMTMIMKSLLSCELHFDQEIIMSKKLDTIKEAG